MSLVKDQEVNFNSQVEGQVTAIVKEVREKTVLIELPSGAVILVQKDELEAQQ